MEVHRKDRGLLPQEGFALQILAAIAAALRRRRRVSPFADLRNVTGFAQVTPVSEGQGGLEVVVRVPLEALEGSVTLRVSIPPGSCSYDVSRPDEGWLTAEYDELWRDRRLSLTSSEVSTLLAGSPAAATVTALKEFFPSAAQLKAREEYLAG